MALTNHPTNFRTHPDELTHRAFGVDDVVSICTAKPATNYRKVVGIKAHRCIAYDDRKPW